MTPDQLARAVLRSVHDAVESGELGVAVPSAARLRRPPHGGGHWATGIALRLAGPAGLPAPEVARVLCARLARVPGVAGVEIRGGGFLNITLGERADAALLAEILRRPPPAALPEDPARDAARWAGAAGAADSGTGGLLLVQRAENPLFRVRHAHARSRALLRGGEALGVVPEPGAVAYAYAAERGLLALLGEPPEASRRPVRRLTAVADAFWETERARPVLPVGDEKPGPVHRARLALAEAAGLALADGLCRIGVSAPAHV